MLRYFSFLLGLLLLSACGDGVNQSEDLEKVAGSYFGKLKLNAEHEVDVQLQLKPNGFYLISHQDLETESELVRENGVYIVQDQEIELARKQMGLRYFRYVDGKIFVYNLFHEPYTNFSDSNFYLNRQ